MKLYGQVFELVTDPFVMGDGVIFLYGLEKNSGRATQVRVPLPVVQMARNETLKAA